VNFDNFCDSVGLNASVAINLFIKTVDDKNRLVYHVDAEGRLYIAQCRTHYGDKR